MAGKARPSLRKKTLGNVMLSNLSNTDKECIKAVFEEADGIVRCKDCKHFTAKEGYEYIGGFCNVTDVVTHGRRADAYCSMGERRDNAAD